MTLVLTLHEQALIILDKIYRNYATVSEPLELRFGNQYLRQVFQSQLKLRIQQSNEVLQELKLDKNNSHAFPILMTQISSKVKLQHSTS